MSVPQPFTIQKSNLPATCSLYNPPADVTIELVQLFDSTNTPAPIGLSSPTSFIIPGTTTAGSYKLEVAATGGPLDPQRWKPVNVVENTTPPTLMGIIDDGNGKYVRIPLVVL
jgi:hypothetical protein